MLFRRKIKKKTSTISDLEKLIQINLKLRSDYTKKHIECEKSRDVLDEHSLHLSIAFTKVFKKEEIDSFLVYVIGRLSGIDAEQAKIYHNKFCHGRFDVVDIKQYLYYREQFFIDYEESLKKKIKKR